MRKAVIFDIDGTILDSMPVWEHAGEWYLRSIGVEPEKELSGILFPMSLEDGADYIISHYHLEQTRSQVVKGVKKQIRKFYFEEVQRKPGAAELLERLEELKVPAAAATSGDKECAEAALRRLGMRKSFRFILTCSEVGAGKQHPDIYLAAKELLGTEPGETWVVEDALHALQTAKKAGFCTAGVYDPANKEQEEIARTADVYLHSLEEWLPFWQEKGENI